MLLQVHELKKITCISSLSLIDKLQFPFCFFNLHFLLQLPISSPVSQTIMELFSSSSFTSIICPSMASQRRNFFSGYDQFDLLFYIGYYLEVSFSICSRTCSLVTFSDHFIFSILLQHHISKLSKYLHSNFLSVQVSEPYKAVLQT